MALIELNDRTIEARSAVPQVSASAGAEKDTATQRAILVVAFFCAGTALWAGQKFMIPLVSGIMLAMLVAPLVAGLVRVIRLEFLSVVLALLTVVAISVVAIAFFGGHITRVVDRVPDMIRAVTQQLATSGPANSTSIVGRFRDAITELERVAGEAVALPVTESRKSRAPTKAVDAQAPKPAPAVSLTSDSAAVVRQTALSGSSALAGAVTTISVTLFTALFILLGGSGLRRKFLDLWGASPEGRDRASKALDEAARQTRIYAGVLLLTNTLIAAAVFVAFLAVGLPDPGGWAVAAGLLHVVPYLGMALLTVLGAAEAYLALGNLGGALAIAGFIVAVSTIIGTLVSAWLQARSSKMNPAAVFVGLMFWGALWGIWGLLLGPALVVLMKVIAEQIPSGRRFAQLLSG